MPGLLVLLAWLMRPTGRHPLRLPERLSPRGIPGELRQACADHIVPVPPEDLVDGGADLRERAGQI